MLPVVHIHLGPQLPPYYWHTVRQTRRFHSGPFFARFRRTQWVRPNSRSFPRRESSTRVGMNQARCEPCARLVVEPTVQDGFWHYALERMFVLAELMRDEGLTQILHLENDVTIYFDPEKIASTMERCFGEDCAVSPLGPQRDAPRRSSTPGPKERWTRFAMRSCVAAAGRTEAAFVVVVGDGE